MGSLYRFIVAGVVLVAYCQAKSIPSYIKPCKRSDPEINKCIIKQVENIRPHFKDGIAEFDLPPFDPLSLPKVTMNHGNGQAVNFDAEFTNIIVSGSRDVVIKDVNLDLEKLTVDIKMFFPRLRIESDYNIKGKILVLPISGNGHSDGNYTNIDSHMKLNGKYTIRDGKRYLEILGQTVKLNIGDSALFFGNLFNGNKELGDATNKMINENSKEILQEITPLIEETVGALVIKIVGRVFDNFPVDDLILNE